jgi:hypothetical protein
MVDQNQEKSVQTSSEKKDVPKPVQPGPKLPRIFFVLMLVATLGLAALLLLNDRGTQEVFAPTQGKFVPLEKGTWRFIVSGDSRNCGDVVVPTIAAHSAAYYQPSFYWHLGDLRAIYKIDEDMAAEAQQKGQYLSCKSYLERAWPDFIEHQIATFGTTRFYLGIGNHELIEPRTRAEFSLQFEDWLATPRRQMVREEGKLIAMDPSKPCQEVAKKKYVSALPYYHWIQGTIDFIYLDNSSGSFSYKSLAGNYSQDQVVWFDCILGRAEKNTDISTVVVGMHEALPDSSAKEHAMCDTSIADKKDLQESCDTGSHVYKALVELQKKKHVYVLSSHSHFYLKGIFDAAASPERLPGWIIGTAGAVRYDLPKNVKPGPSAQQDVYGYLLATVKQDGQIDFDFKEVKESDVPSEVRQRYPSSFPNWCFAHNAEHKDPVVVETTNRCIPFVEPEEKPPATKKAKGSARD